MEVVFIPKPGRDSYAQAKSYRPISLSSFLLKLLERLIERHIRDETLSKQPLSRYQYAYQPGKSCEMAIHEVTRKVEATLRDKEIALGAFIDIEGAFDNTLISSIHQAMESREVHPTVRRWVSTMLKHRQVYTTLNDHTVGAIATRGCPQGGVLSPLL